MICNKNQYPSSFIARTAKALKTKLTLAEHEKNKIAFNLLL